MTTITTTPARQEVHRRLAALGDRLCDRLRRSAWARWVLLAELAGAFVLHAVHRGHSYIEGLDEAVHAIVAKHLAQHPFTPVLYVVGALSRVDARDWSHDHIFLHIPPFGMWASAAAMRVLGATPFADRLPGLFFVLGGMVVVYLLGSRLFGPAVGLVGAAFAGFTPYGLLVSQGFYFGDSTETPLMLLTPLVVLGIVLAYRSGKLRWLILAGVAQGLCYLDKGALGLAPAAILVALLACERLFPPEHGWARMGWRGLAVFVGCLAVVALPYNVYLARAFPVQSAQEAQLWKANFFTATEGWGRPLDFHATIYLYQLYGPALALLLALAAVAVTVVALRRRSRADLVPAVWIVAIYVPLSLSITKTPPYTYPAIPALGLAVGRLVQLGLSERAPRWQGVSWRVLLLAVLVGTAAAPFELTTQLAPYELDYARIPSLAAPAEAMQSLLFRLAPYVYLLAAAALAAVALMALLWLAERSGVRRERVEPMLAWAIVWLALLAWGAYWLVPDTAVLAHIPSKTEIADAPVIGAQLAHDTPPIATLIAQAQDPMGLYRLPMMFWADRDIYAEPDLSTARVCALARQAATVNSPLFVVARPQEVPASASSWQVRATIGNGRWVLIAPACPGGG